MPLQNSLHPPFIKGGTYLKGLDSMPMDKVLFEGPERSCQILEGSAACQVGLGESPQGNDLCTGPEAG
jgi:hypothetical protein